MWRWARTHAGLALSKTGAALASGAAAGPLVAAIRLRGHEALALQRAQVPGQVVGSMVSFVGQVYRLADAGRNLPARWPAGKWPYCLRDVQARGSSCDRRSGQARDALRRRMPVQPNVLRPTARSSSPCVHVAANAGNCKRGAPLPRCANSPLPLRGGVRRGVPNTHGRRQDKTNTT